MSPAYWNRRDGGDGSDVFVGNAGRVAIVVLEGSTDGTSVDVIEGFEEQAVKMIAIIKKITFCFILFPFEFSLSYL